MKKINYLELMNFKDSNLEREVGHAVRAMHKQTFYSSLCEAVVEVHYYIVFIQINGDTIILESPEEILNLYRDFLKHRAFDHSKTI